MIHQGKSRSRVALVVAVKRQVYDHASEKSERKGEEPHILML